MCRTTELILTPSSSRFTPSSFPLHHSPPPPPLHLFIPSPLSVLPTPPAHLHTTPSSSHHPSTSLHLPLHLPLTSSGSTMRMLSKTGMVERSPLNLGRNKGETHKSTAGMTKTINGHSVDNHISNFFTIRMPRLMVTHSPGSLFLSLQLLTHFLYEDLKCQ